MSEIMKTDFSQALYLAPEDAAVATRLFRLWVEKQPRNLLRDRYYHAHVPVDDLGVSIPKELAGKVDARVDWPRKAVLALVNRSQFDGYTTEDEDAAGVLDALVERSGLKILYRKAAIGEVRHCCAFLTVTDDAERGKTPQPVVNAYPATAASAIWDDERHRIKAGMVIAATTREPGSSARVPSVVNVFTDENVIVLRRVPGAGARGWWAEYLPHSMGRCLMEPMAHEPSLERPFGSSRITRAVMSITDDAQREKARAEIAAEFAAFPQKYLLNTDRRNIGEDNRYAAAMGNILEITAGKHGAPVFGQLAQLQMTPHIDYMRSLAAQFSGATNVPLSELGVVSDNPSSAEAIYAAKEALVIDAENLNAVNGATLRSVAIMALAIARGTDFETERSSDVAVRWRNPSMPSVVSQSDAITKQISALPWLAESDVALEEYGYSEEQIKRLQSDRAKAQSRDLTAALLAQGSDAQ